MCRQLFTIGYEGTTINSFIARLHTHNINCLMDIRKLPLSRKPGFSKTALAQRLNHAKIQYVHLKDLGTPKVFRDDLRLTSDYSTFFEKMDSYLTGKHDAIETAYAYALNNTCCLMCFERFAEKCHRTLIASKIRERDNNGLQIINI